MPSSSSSTTTSKCQPLLLWPFMTQCHYDQQQQQQQQTIYHHHYYNHPNKRCLLMVGCLLFSILQALDQSPIFVTVAASSPIVDDDTASAVAAAETAFPSQKIVSVNISFIKQWPFALAKRNCFNYTIFS